MCYTWRQLEIFDATRHTEYLTNAHNRNVMRVRKYSLLSVREVRIMSTQSTPNGPHLNAALLCEKVLQEKDGIISVIRMIDRITLTVNASLSPETLPPLPINLFALISFKSGSARGRHTVKWVTETPSGIRLPEQLLPVLFEGDNDRGVNLILNVNMIVDQEGVYWFEVHLEDQFLTRVPLRILYQRIGQSI